MKCGPFDLEVQVKYCGVNFADLYMRQGLIPTISLPCILGLECVGIVNEIGSKIMSFEVSIWFCFLLYKNGTYYNPHIFRKDSVSYATTVMVVYIEKQSL